MHERQINHKYEQCNNLMNAQMMASSQTKLVEDIIQLHFAEYKYRLRRVQISRGICTPEDRLDRFPAIDQSVSLISHAFAVNKCPRNSLARIYQFGVLDNKSLIKRFVL